jgi:glycosyltransferase involved in cell wall biosynthesis
LLGQVSNMPAVLVETDIAVLPSYREGLPKGLAEAVACRLPLVTTDVPGCRGLGTDGREGLLIPVRDAAALTEAIRRLHNNSAWARELGRAARVRVLAELDERIVIDRTLAVYREPCPVTA